MTDDLEEKTARNEQTHATGQYSEAWKVINEFSGHTKSLSGSQWPNSWIIVQRNWRNASLIDSTISKTCWIACKIQQALSKTFRKFSATCSLTTALCPRKNTSKPRNPSNWVKVVVQITSRKRLANFAT